MSALAVVKKVNKSCRATELLKQLAGEKLVKKLPHPMGFIISSHMLEVKQHLTTVSEKLEWENLNVAQWKHYLP